MSIESKNKTSFTPIILSRQYSFEGNRIKDFNKTFSPIIPNNFNQKNKFGFSQNKTFYPDKKEEYHPIEFYALGKIPNGTVYPSLYWNKGIKSTSNNIIERNALSINTKQFNQINIHKNLASLYNQNVTENNYMMPVKSYKTYEKYRISRNTTNFEIYKIMKEKYFSKDIASTIAKGKYLNKTDFIEEKYNSMKKLQNKKNEVKNDINEEKSINNKCIEKVKEHSKSGFIYKDPNDYTKKLLKNNLYYFDKNNTQMIKPKKWKIDGKK